MYSAFLLKWFTINILNEWILKTTGDTKIKKNISIFIEKDIRVHNELGQEDHYVGHNAPNLEILKGTLPLAIHCWKRNRVSQVNNCISIDLAHVMYTNSNKIIPPDFNDIAF